MKAPRSIVIRSSRRLRRDVDAQGMLFAIGGYPGMPFARSTMPAYTLEPRAIVTMLSHVLLVFTRCAGPEVQESVIICYVIFVVNDPLREFTCFSEPYKLMLTVDFAIYRNQPIAGSEASRLFTGPSSLDPHKAPRNRVIPKHFPQPLSCKFICHLGFSGVLNAKRPGAWGAQGVNRQPTIS